MAASTHKNARIASVVAGTLVALSCGTNYAYSAWAPQFAHHMKLSSTESNLIGVAGNLGMYAMGIPMGLLTDARGPRFMTLVGSALLILGYYPIYLAYKSGEGSFPIVLLCFFAFLTGMGGCSAFGAAIKTSACNFPDHRGTATAFPLAAFGLSALFWSNVSSLIFKDDTSRFLLLLALGTSILSLVSTPFLKIFQNEPYAPLPHRDTTEPSESQSQLRRASAVEESNDDIHNSTAFDQNNEVHARGQSVSSAHLHHRTDESSSLVAQGDGRPSFDTLDDDYLKFVDQESHHRDIRGLAMLREVDFWQLFLIMALLSGIGLMTINNIGNSAKALWLYYDDSATGKFIHERQVMHVSILSLGNFLGRLSSGIGSDILVKKLNMSRFWCLFISAVVFTGTQLAGFTISNPNTLVVVTAFTGVAYGFLFGNWGVMTLAPIFSGNAFNLIYGTVYDRHSVVGPDGDNQCPDGLTCYRTAYYVTLISGLAGIVVCLWSIFRERRIHNAMRQKTGHRLA
ncbi:hypothetical protein N7495_004020 [Penicillium taxi]|uniref:uncharacterized protein n=1 Tax=Penicillium taxi TaxID=168475 RepID=UPI00254566D3|nr:uncharacterized protein N7495_004020 [Penicillium taxi]KAJ5899276.1 hypothetical protein N7495_004020 [Penicillium taxi]